VLKFMDEPLGSVVSNVNRYSSRRIVLEDADLASRPFTGTVYEGRIEDWLSALERVFPLDVVDEGGDVIRLQRRHN
jgi:transmembrane sensor